MIRFAAVASAVVVASLIMHVEGRGQDKKVEAPRAAQPASPATSADEVAIRANADAFVQAFDKADAKALSEFWTDNGEYVGEDGTVHNGRKAIEAGYAQFFAHNPNARMHMVIDSVRVLGSTAIEEGRAVVEPQPFGAPGAGHYSAVHVKVDGKWMLASVRDIHVPTPSAYEGLADFEWLIGTWTVEENGITTESTCQWGANKSIVQRNYTTTHPDGTKASGVQIIGWNPQGGHVQSWNFSSDGGHAIGVWTPIESGWSAEIQGTTGDGTPITAVNVLVRLDDNAYAWQSVQRTAGGKPIADTAEVVIRRSQVHK